MSLLNKATDFLQDKSTAFLAVDISYSRNGDSFNVLATTGSTMFKVIDEYGAAVYWRGQDFLVASADMPFTPERGDVITLDGKTFKVLAPDNEPCFRYCDADGVRMRIHTKRLNV